MDLCLATTACACGANGTSPDGPRGRGHRPGACSGGTVYSLILMSRHRCALQTGLLGISVCLATAVRPRGGSQAGDAPGLGAAAPSHANPGARVAARATCLCPPLGADLGHRPANPQARLSNGPGIACPRAPLSFPPWRGERWAWPIHPGPLPDAAGCEGRGRRAASGRRRLLATASPSWRGRCCTRAGSNPCLGRSRKALRRPRGSPLRLLRRNASGEPRLARLCRPRGPGLAADPAQWRPGLQEVGGGCNHSGKAYP